MNIHTLRGLPGSDTFHIDYSEAPFADARAFRIAQAEAQRRVAEKEKWKKVRGQGRRLGTAKVPFHPGDRRVWARLKRKLHLLYKMLQDGTNYAARVVQRPMWIGIMMNTFLHIGGLFGWKPC
jgi:hypothetical protein